MMKSIAELKKMIVTEQQIKTIMDYFFDLEDSGMLQNLCINLTPKVLNEDLELKTMLGNIQLTLKDFFKKEAIIKEPVIHHIPHENFYHGIFMVSVSATPGFIIYFSDIKVGAFSVTKKDRGAEMFLFSLASQNTSEIVH